MKDNTLEGTAFINIGLLLGRESWIVTLDELNRLCGKEQS